MIFKKIKTKNNTFTLYKIQNILSEERLVNLVRGRECFVILSILLVQELHV